MILFRSSKDTSVKKPEKESQPFCPYRLMRASPALKAQGIARFRTGIDSLTVNRASA